MACYQQGYCQSAATNKKTDTASKSLTADVSIQYLDETGQTIDPAVFAIKVKEGGYQYIPTAENGHLKSLQLTKAGAGLMVGADAPAFSVFDIQGNKYNLKEMKGRVFVLNFWFTQCVGCIQEMPPLNDLVEMYEGDPGVIFLGVTYDPEEKVQHFLSKKVFKYNIVCDQLAMIKDYGINIFPTTVVIDSNGKVAFISTGLDTEGISKLGKSISTMPRYFPINSQ